MDRAELSRALDREVESLRAELIEATSRILQFETVSGATDDPGKQRCAEQMRACAEYLEGLCTRMGFRWIEKPGRYYCIEWPAELRAGDKPIVIGIPTHIDVVPASGQWTHPPFSGTVADGTIWGRGTQDDKGPLIATLYGLYALKRLGFRPGIAARIIIGTQEEIGDWSDLREYVADHGAADYGFTPDANFPIIIAEKGLVNLEAKAIWDPAAAKSAGPVEFVALKGGTRSNVVPDLCEITLRYPKAERDAILKELFSVTTAFTVENRPASITLLPDKARDLGDGREELLISFLGKSAHGSLPEKGHNAALDALKFVTEMETFPEPARLVARFLQASCSDLLGNRLNIASTHDFMGPTTVNLGVVRIHDTGAQGTINVRATLGMDRKEVVRRAGDLAKAYAEQTGLQFGITGEERGFNAHYLDPERAGKFLTGLQDGFQAVTGELPELRSIGGTTYAKAMPNCCAFGPVLESAGEEELAHQADERITVESQVRNAKIYGLGVAFAALNLAGSPAA